MEVEVKDLTGAKVGTVELPAEIFEAPIKKDLMHQALVRQQANARLGTHETKGRGEVAGGGKKPFKQKGTGRARAGSSRSPLWRHGGTVFGPLPRDYSYTIPKKEKRAALAAALAAKVSENRLIVLDKIMLAEPKTGQMSSLLKNLGVAENALVLLGAENKNVALASRNMPSVKVLRMENINVYDLLKYRYLITTGDVLTALAEVHGK